MGTERYSGILLAAVLAAVFSTDATAAECGSHAVDACLIGAWKQTGGGAAEWMRENMKMAQVKMSASDAVITLSRDGSFSTSKVDATAEVSAKDSEMHASVT